MESNKLEFGTALYLSGIKVANHTENFGILLRICLD